MKHKRKSWQLENNVSDVIAQIISEHVDAQNDQRPCTGPHTGVAHHNVRSQDAEQRMRKMIDKLSAHAIVTVDSCLGYRYTDLTLCDLRSEWCYMGDCKSHDWRYSRAHVMYLEIDDVSDDNPPYIMGFNICSDTVGDGRAIIEKLKDVIEASNTEAKDDSVNAMMRREAAIFVRQARLRLKQRKEKAGA